MCQDISKHEEDCIWLRDELAKWWKLPTPDQEEWFCERVAIMCCENENINENEIRKQVFERVIFR